PGRHLHARLLRQGQVRRCDAHHPGPPGDVARRRLARGGRPRCGLGGDSLGALDFALLRRRARCDGVAEGWSCGPRTPTTPSLRATPPRRGGECVELCPPVKEGTTRQCRRGVVSRASNPTTPSLRATPPRRGGECVELCPPAKEGTTRRCRGRGT